MTSKQETGLGVMNPPRRLLVVGGSTGIGGEIVRRSRSDGYIVDYTCRSVAGLSSEAEGADVIGTRYSVDLEDYGAVVAFAQQLAEENNQYYGLIYNAGVSYDSLLSHVRIDRAKTLFEVNFWGFIEISKVLAPTMLRKRSGRVIAISSIASARGSRGNAIYSASKGALSAAVRAIADEFAPRGVTANSILPGYVRTAMVEKYSTDAAFLQKIPVKRAAEASEIAAMVSFLLSDDAQYITGSSMTIDGGLSNCL